jgi:hypothetical protein
LAQEVRLEQLVQLGLELPELPELLVDRVLQVQPELLARLEQQEPLAVKVAQEPPD